MALWTDIASTLPLELIAFLFGARENVVLFRSNRLLRLVRVRRYRAVLEQYAWSRQTAVHIGAQRMWQLFFIMAISAHYAGCIFYGVALQRSRQGDSPTWGENDNLWHVNATVALPRSPYVDLGISIFSFSVLGRHYNGHGRIWRYRPNVSRRQCRLPCDVVLRRHHYVLCSREYHTHRCSQGSC